MSQVDGVNNPSCNFDDPLQATPQCGDSSNILAIECTDDTNLKDRNEPEVGTEVLVLDDREIDSSESKIPDPDQDNSNSDKKRNKKEKLLLIVVPIIGFLLFLIILLSVLLSGKRIIYVSKDDTCPCNPPVINEDGSCSSDCGVSNNPSFVLPNFEDEQKENKNCKWFSRYKDINDKDEKEWKEGNDPANGETLNGNYIFEFKMVCENIEYIIPPINVSIDTLPPFIDISSIPTHKEVKFLVTDEISGVSSLVISWNDESLEVTEHSPSAKHKDLTITCDFEKEECTLITFIENPLTFIITDKVENTEKLVVKPHLWSCNDEDITDYKDFKIPDTIIDLEKDMLKGCENVQGLYLPDNLGSLGPGTFDNLLDLSAFNIAENNPIYRTNEKGILYQIDQEDGITLLKVPPKFPHSGIIIPENLVAIEKGAFKNCSGLRILPPDEFQKTTTLYLKVGDEPIIFEPESDYIFKSNLVEGKFTMQAHTTLGESPLAAALEGVQCVEDGGKYRRENVHQMLVGEETVKVSLTTGVCYVETYGGEETLIPLFDKDEVFTIKVDTRAPSIDFGEGKINPLVVVKDEESGLKSVNVCWSETDTDVCSDSPTDILKTQSPNDYFEWECGEAEKKTICNLVPLRSGWFSIEATDIAENVVKEVEKISEWKCSKVEEGGRVIIPEGVAILNKNSFDLCPDVSDIIIPSTLIRVSPEAFDDLEHLVSFSRKQETENAVFETKDGILYSKGDERSLVRFPPAKEHKNFEVPDSISVIAPHAFVGTTLIQSITLHPGITRIGDGAFKNSSVTSLYIQDINPSGFSIIPGDRIGNNSFRLYMDNFNGNDSVNVTVFFNDDNIFSVMDDSTRERFVVSIENENNWGDNNFVLPRKDDNYTKYARLEYRDKDEIISINSLENVELEIKVMLLLLDEKVPYDTEIILYRKIEEDYVVKLLDGDNNIDINIRESNEYCSLDETGEKITFKKVGENFKIQVILPGGGKIENIFSVLLKDCFYNNYILNFPNEIEIIDSSVLIGCTFPEILVIPNDVEEITRDAPISIPSLKAIVVGEKNPIKPEDCNFGKSDGKYKHVHIFRTSQGSQPVFALPYTLFWNERLIPILLYPQSEVGEIDIINAGTGRSVEKLETQRTTYKLEEVRLGVGSYLVGGAEKIGIEVVGWSEGTRGHGVGKSGSLKIPYGVYKIGRSQYYQYSGNRLTSVEIPPTVKVLLETSLHSETLNKIVFNNSGVKEIEGDVFGYMRVEEFEVPTSVNTMGEGVFHNSKLKKIVLSGHISDIKSINFQNCWGLNTVIIQNGITRMSGDFIFDNTGLKNIVFPPSLWTNTENIGEHALEGSQIDIVCYDDRNTNESCRDLVGENESWGKTVNIECGDCLKYL